MKSEQEIKQINMPEFLGDHYGLKFYSAGDQYVSVSPFKKVNKLAFFIRKVDGTWKFKDIVCNCEGSIIDFVIKKEGYSTISQEMSSSGVTSFLALRPTTSSRKRGWRPFPGREILILSRLKRAPF